WSTRFIFLDSHEAISKLTAFRRKWKQKVRGFMSQLFNTNNGYVDEDALSMVNDASSAIAETNSGLVSQGYITSVIVLMNEDRQKVE
ncbi:conjugal transfer protein TrbE, partial [Escherichia coli]|nr:conjugal transfer protein TrbE [Escherichia coli]